MDILIVEHFTGELDGRGNSRFLYLANLLAENKNNSVELVTSDFCHDTKSRKKVNLEAYPFKITLAHEDGYPTNVCPQRLISHRFFGSRVRELLFHRAKKPDVVYCGVPSLSCANAAVEFCRENNIRLVLDIQDIWPEAFQLGFNVPVLSNLVYAPLKVMANKIYGAADAIIAVSDTYAKRAMRVNDKCEEATVVYLGTDKQMFDSYKASNILPCLKKSSKDTIKIVYIGNLEDDCDLQTVIDAIADTKSFINAELLIIGDGPMKSSLESRALEKEIVCTFVSGLDYPQMMENIAKCDIAVNPAKHGSLENAANRVWDYAMTGLPIVNMQESEETTNLIAMYSAGINCSCENVDDVAKALKELATDEDLRKTMSIGSLRLGEENIDGEIPYHSLVHNMLNSQTGTFRIGYCGTLGNSYDITVVLDALRLIVSDAPEKANNLQFIVMGDGPRREEFEEKSKGLPVVFTGRLPYSEMVWVLCHCDMAVNPIEQGAMQSIINKHMDYAMAGLPIVSTQECEEYRKLVESYRMGINCKCGDPVDVAAAIMLLADDDELRKQMGENARRCAEELFDRGKTYRKLANMIDAS